MKKAILTILTPALLAGCTTADFNLITRKAWEEVTTTPRGTVSTAWAIRHPRLIEIEIETEYLQYALHNGPYTYSARLYEHLHTQDEITVLIAEWNPERRAYLASNRKPANPS